MTKHIRILFAAWLMASCIAGSPTPCAANSAVTLKPEVNIKRNSVRLSDLFNGVPSEIDRDIAQAPPACHPAIYDENVLNKLADTYRLDWQSLPNADHAVVSTDCARITGDMIRDAVVARLKADGNTKERSFDIAFDNKATEIDLATDQQPDFTLNNFTYDAGSKHFRADLTAETAHGPYTATVGGHVAIKRSVPILAHRLESGTTITEADLDWMQVPEDRITADVISESSQLLGREVRRDTAEGEILRAHDVVPARLVTRGSLVTMKIETPFITITSQGKAQQDGAQGEVVRVLNTQSQRIVEGTVTGPGVIEIHTAQKLALAQ